MSKNFLACFRNFLGGVVKTAFHLSIRIVWGKTILWRTYLFSIILRHWAWFLWPFMKIFLRGSENFILRVQRNSLRKNNYLKNVCIFFHFGTLSKLFLAFLTKYCRSWENCILRVQRNSLRKTMLSEKSVFYIHYRTLRQRFLAICRNNFGGAVKTPFYVSRGTLWRKQFFSEKNENLKYFSDIEPNSFGFSTEYFRRCCRNCFLLVHRDNKKENNCFELLYQFEWLSKNFLAFFGQTFGGVVETALYMSIRTVWEKKTLFEERVYCLSFWDSEQKFFAIFRKFFRRVVKTAFYLSIGKVWGKTIFWRTYVYFIFLGYWAKTFGLVLKKQSQDLSKLHFTYENEWFEERKRSEKFRLFLIFLHIEQKFFGFFSKKFRSVCQNCILLAHRKFPAKHFFQESMFSYIFRTLNENFSAYFSKIFRRSCQNCIILVHRNSWRKTKFSEKSVFSSPFCTLRRRFFAFCQKNFGGAVKFPFYVSIGTFWRKQYFFSDRNEIFKSFSDIEPNSFGLSSERFRRCCRNCLLHVHRGIRKENKLFDFLYQFGILSKKFWAFFRQKFWRVVKTAFYLSIETVWGKTFFWRTYVLFVILGYWAKTFGLVLKKRSQDLSKLRFTYPRNGLMKENVLKKLGFLCFCTLSKNFFGFCSKKFRRVCQNCILLAHRNFPVKQFFQESLFS